MTTIDEFTFGKSETQGEVAYQDDDCLISLTYTRISAADMTTSIALYNGARQIEFVQWDGERYRNYKGQVFPGEAWTEVIRSMILHHKPSIA